METVVALALIGFLVGGMLASLAEYWVHVLMHRRIFLGRTHMNHHREPEDESWFKQFAYYVLGGALPWAIVIAVCWSLEVLPLGVGVAVGGLTWSAWVAYAHTLQHYRPELVFWMKLPVHHLHHEYETSHHNFGLSVDWWDRVFGTYKPLTWKPRETVRISVWGLLKIRWF
jgi:sterol desaturase/sphingolipid hydroxylase (fatty acid hydroxylase superfamily)